MRLYLAAHHANRMLLGSSLLGVAALVLAGQVLPIPQLSGRGAPPVLLSQVCAALMAPLAAHGFGGPALRMETAVPRSLLRPDLTLLAVLVGPAMVTCLIGIALGSGAELVVYARNSVLYVGLALVILTGWGRRAAAGVALAYFMAVVVIGRLDGRAAFWAIPRADATHPTIVVTAVVLLIGTVAFHRSARHRAPADS